MEHQTATPTAAIEHRFHLPIADDESLREFVRLAWGVKIPDVQVCSDHTTPWRAFADAYFARNRVAVWKASRGFGGKSFMLALLGLTEAATLKADVNILGGSGEQSENVHKYAKRFWDYEGAPSNLLASDPLKRETRLAWGNVIKALLASSRSVRGPHPQKLRLDEVDEMELSIFDAAMGQAMSKNGIAAQTVISSTHQHADGTMTEVLKRAAEKGWPVYEWCISGDCGIMGIDRIIPVREIQRGERIYAHDNGRIIETAVTDAWCSGVRQTVIVSTERDSIKCTPEHRILTDQGWRRAGNIQCGDMVCEVRNAQGNAPRRAVQDVSLQQEMPGLWQVDQQQRGAVQVLRLQTQEQLTHTRADREDDLSNVRQAQTGAFQDMPVLLQERNGQEEYKTSGHDGAGKGARGAKWEQPQASKQGRKSSRGTLGRVGAGLSNAARIWALCSRFRIAGLLAGYRGQRAVLAQQPRTKRARSEEAPSNRGQGNEATNSVGRPSPSMGLASVRSVRKGPSVTVYDLTVASGHSFIANGIVVHNCYKETEQGWLDAAEVEGKRQDVTVVMWNVEYDLQEPSPESRAIMPEAVAAMFCTSLGQFSGSNGEYIEIEPPLAVCSACGLLAEFGDECPECHSHDVELIPYVTGADWARKTDWTIIPTLRLDVQPARVVAFERCGRLPWPVMVSKLDARLARYGGQAYHDGTGLGDVVDGYLEHDAEGFIMVGRARSALLSNYISAVERNEVESPDITFMHNEHKYASVDDVYGSGHLPDSIAAMALAWRGVGEGRVFSFGWA